MLGLRHWTKIGVLLALTCCGRQDKGKVASDGSEMFLNACARCHGAEGGGGQPLFPGGPAPRNFRDPAVQARLTDDDIRKAILQGTAGGMPSFAAVFGPAQVETLVGHVRNFGRSPGNPSSGTR
ncbi:MAG: cytochrome c [Polyangiaceae bacterium]|nr:cytochrome c [Polyangiaceae bacterium]